jgi:hypothetical protein
MVAGLPCGGSGIVGTTMDELRPVAAPVSIHLVPVFERRDAPPTLVRIDDIREIRPESIPRGNGPCAYRHDVGSGTEILLTSGLRYTHESPDRFLHRLVAAGLAIDEDVQSLFREELEQDSATKEVA